MNHVQMPWRLAYAESAYHSTFEWSALRLLNDESWRFTFGQGRPHTLNASQSHKFNHAVGPSSEHLRWYVSSSCRHDIMVLFCVSCR